MNAESDSNSPAKGRAARVNVPQAVNRERGADEWMSLNPGPTESNHIHSAADIGGAAVLLNVGERIGLLPHLSERAVVSSSSLAQVLDLPEPPLVDYLQALTSAGLLEPVDETRGQYRAGPG